MKKNATIWLSGALGIASAFAFPILLLTLGRSVLPASLWEALLAAYFIPAKILEPVVWKLLPWSELVPGGGAPGAFALIGLCVLLFWGLFFSALWFTVLRRWRR